MSIRIQRFAPFLLAVFVTALWTTPVWAEGRSPEEDAEATAARIVAGLKDKSNDVRFKAAQDAADCPHESLLKPLLRLLADPEPMIRQAATKALGTRETKSDKKKAAAGLNPRLRRLSKKPEDQDELLIVVAALDKLAQPSSIKPLLADIEPGTETDVAQARLNAVAAVPHRDAVDRLIQYLAKGRKRSHHNGAASKALQYATGQRFGRDPDRWRAWWRDHEKTFDFDAMAREREEAAAKAKEKAEKKKERQRKKREGKKNKGGGKKKDEGA